MGSVYRGLDESLQRFVAVKVLRASEQGSSGSEKQVQRLLDEAVSQARLNHPNVVTIYYVGRDDEEPFFAMELLPGPTLGQLVRHGPLDFADVINFARQVVSALKHASNMGLVHGDIKPSNLILAEEGTVKLCDFGLAKTEQTSPAEGISGTLSYMAPELTLGEEPSIHSDMYSLGVTLFELTFGRRPYAISGSTLEEQLSSQHGAEVEFPEKWPTQNVPERWRHLLGCLLEREPSKRFVDYDEFDNALRQLAPVGFTNAGLLNRGLALAVDFLCLALLMLPFMLPGQLAIQVSEHLAALGWAGENIPVILRNLTRRFGMLGLLTPMVPLFATWYEWRGWRTPGRYLFQVRVVDTHGLRLGRRQRVIRSLIRLFPIWIGAFSVAALALGFDMLVLLMSPLDELVLLIDTIPVLGRKRQSVHDRLVGSHVVLDTHLH